MCWLNSDRMRMMLVGIVAGIVIGGGSAKGDFTFGEPVNLGPPISTSVGEIPEYVTSDGLEMYLSCYNKTGGYGGWDIWVSTRETVDDDWGAPMNLGPLVNTGQADDCSYLSDDGLEIYLDSTRSSGFGDFDIWVSRRATKDGDWEQPMNLGPVVNSPSGDALPCFSPDGLELYFTSNRPGGFGDWDIWVSRRAIKDDSWGEPANLGPIVNSSASECWLYLSSDGLILFFSEERARPIRPGGFGNVDMWMTRRASVSDPWGTPVNLGPTVNSSSLDCRPMASHNGSTLYFASERPGGLGGIYGDIYQAPIIPIVDFNGDRIVDAEDMCILVDHWGEDYPLCDIGPMPWGDGIVDVQDLVVLAEHLFEETLPPGCIAYWKLDQTEGNIAHNSAGFNDGICHGDPLWQPTDGRIGGALQLDGIDDYVETDFVLNPAGGAFSVFAWIKGGAPGQVILSQIDSTNWLGADPLDGKLTGLGSSDDQSSLEPLLSEFMITDGNWHNIGIVVGAYQSMRFRSLYVDGERVAIDTQSVELISSDGGLYIGAGKTLDAGTFFSGLIDDVRIYNQALTAEEIAVLAQ